MKVGSARQTIESIARHDSETIELREAALQHLVAVIVHETIELKARHAARAASQAAAIEPNERA